jgi:hypothetical protein
MLFRVLRPEFRLNKFLRLLVAERLQRFPVDEETRCLPDLKGGGIGQILLNQPDNRRVIHILFDPFWVDAGIRKELPLP